MVRGKIWGNLSAGRVVKITSSLCPDGIALLVLLRVHAHGWLFVPVGLGIAWARMMGNPSLTLRHFVRALFHRISGNGCMS